jgi:hypothetical protein
MMVGGGGKFFDAFVGGVGKQFPLRIDAGFGSVYGLVANLNHIKVRNIFDRVTPGYISHFLFGNFYNYKTLIPGYNLEGFCQPVLVGPGTENFQYSLHDGPPFPKGLEVER